MKLKKSTFQVSKHLLTLQNRDPKAKEQKKGEGRATTLAKRRKKYTIIKTQYIMVNGEGTNTTTYYCTRQVMIEEEYIMIMKFSKIKQNKHPPPITPAS